MVSDSEKYELVVALDVLSQLTWHKTPGKDQVTALFDMAGDADFATRASLYMALLATEGKSPPKEGQGSTVVIENGSITVQGRRFLECMVDTLGIDFSGAQQYRSSYKGR